jgi:hypothetical protein
VGSERVWGGVENVVEVVGVLVRARARGGGGQGRRPQTEPPGLGFRERAAVGLMVG